jgi:nitroreductase
MDTRLAIASKREVRQYADRPLPDDAVRRILDAGRVAGSSQNRQNRRFVAVREDRELLERLAATVYVPANLTGAALAVAIVTTGKGPTSFDAGRAAQNMMLAAWNEGIGSTPNGIADAGRLAELLGHGEDERVAIVLTFGYPARPSDPERRTPEEWIDAADRRPFDEVVDLR